MSRRLFALPALLVAAALVLAPTAEAQSLAGRVVGTVRDESGATVTAAAIVLEQQGTGLVRRTTSSSTGDYNFSFVPIGDYTVSAEGGGFRISKRAVTVAVQATVRVDFELSVAERAEDVTVEASAPVVRTDSAELGEVISEERISDLPLNGRRFSDLVLLTAGSGLSTAGTSDTPLLQTGPNLNINGSRPTHNSYTIDGVTATDYYFSNLSMSTSVDAIAEFKIVSGQYGAEFGGKGGGHVNVVTRGGSNDFRATAFEFLRNDAFDAHNYFAPRDQPVPPFRQNQFGGSLGGPILKNRLFFFANYEGSRTTQTVTQLATVPTAAMRAGNFSGLNPIFDPSTTAGGVRRPFPGNVIPADRLDPAGQVLLEVVPLPNRPGLANNFLGQAERDREDDQVNLRLDYSMDGGDLLFARFSAGEIEALEPFGARGSNALPGFPSLVNTKSRNGALSYTRNLSSRHVMNVLLGYNYVGGGINTTNQDLDIARRAGILVLQDVSAELRGVPAVNTVFTSPFGDDLSTLIRTNSTYQASAQFFFATGRHGITYGAEVMRHHFEPLAAINARGTMSFTGRYTAGTTSGTNGNGFADFILGLPSSGSVLSGNAIERARSTWYAVFVQDNWRVNDKLTVNLGLRYDLMPPFYDLDDRLSAIDLEGQRVIVSSSNGQVGEGADFAAYASYPLPYVSSEEAGWPRSLIDTDKTNLSPRVGLAYSFNPKTVLRGGYSMVYSVPPLNLQARMDRNPPFSGLLSPTNPVAAPVFTTQTMFADAQAPPSFGYLVRDFRNSRVMQWSVGVDRELGPVGLAVAYVGAKTDFLDWFGGANPASPCASNCAPIEQRRVYPGLGNFTNSNNNAEASYNALQVRATGREWKGLSYVASFTWSKSLDNSSSSSGDNNSVANDPFDLDNDWGPSSYDRRLGFVFSYGWRLPFGEGRRFLNRGGAANAILGGWTVGGIVAAQSGDHFSVSIANCPSNTGGGCRTDIIRDPNLPRGDRTPERWFDTGAFVPPPVGQFGNQGRNVVIGPGLFVWDLSVHKNISLGGDRFAQLRLEIFNVTNHANFGRPDNRFGAASFGAVTTAGAARQMQLGLKLNF
jgi:outer membrane receptor protein involved in Fe transport